MRTKYRAYFEKCAEIARVTQRRVQFANSQKPLAMLKKKVKAWVVIREIFCPGQFCIESYGSLWVRLLYEQKLKKDASV